MTIKHEERNVAFSYRYGEIAPFTGCCEQGPGLPLACCPVGQMQSGSVTYKVLDYTRTGQSNAGWKSIIKQGGNASSPMIVDKTVITRLSAMKSSATYFHSPCCGSRQIIAEGTYGSGLPFVGEDLTQGQDALVSRVQAAASRKFVKKVRDLDHQFQGGVFAGQILKTFKMLVNPFGALKKGIPRYYDLLLKRRRNVRRGDPSLRRILAETWLETVFGWQPLLHDVRDAAAALARIYADVPGNWKTFKVYAEEEGDLPSSAGGPIDLGPGLKFLAFTRKKFRFRVSYYGALKHLEKDTAIESFQRAISLSGFDLRSWAPTAWELLPWSFLIDYFTNVGDIVDYYSTDLSQIRRGTRVEHRISRVRKDMVPDYKSTLAYFGKSLLDLSMGACSGMADKVNIIRWSHSSPVYPGFRFDLDPSFKQMLNIGALIAGYRPRYRPFY